MDVLTVAVHRHATYPRTAAGLGRYVIARDGDRRHRGNSGPHANRPGLARVTLSIQPDDVVLDDRVQGGLDVDPDRPRLSVDVVSRNSHGFRRSALLVVDRNANSSDVKRGLP